MNNQWFSKVAVWLVIALVLFTVFKQFDRGATTGNHVAYSDFLEEVRNKRIKQVTLQESPGGGTEIIAVTNEDNFLPVEDPCYVLGLDDHIRDLHVDLIELAQRCGSIHHHV